MKSTPVFVPNKKLILHFDLSAIKLPSNIDKDFFVYDLCAEWIWGKLQKTSKEQPDKVTGWKISLPTLSIEAPQPDLVNYKTYLHQHLHPPKEQYEKLILNLSKGAGAKAKGEIQKNIKNITLPKTLAQSLKEGADPNDKLLAYYNRTGKYEILPSFYKLLLTLKKLKRQFAVIIKAQPNQNHESAISQLNRFFSGEHPLYNGKNGTALVRWDGSKGTHQYLIDELHETVFYSIADQSFATYGTRSVFQEKDPEMFKQKFKSFKSVKLCQGSGEIYSVGHSLLAESASIYEINPLRTVVIDPADYLTHQIYFTTQTDARILSCLGEQITDKRSFVSKVQLFEYLKDIDYFTKIVQSLQNHRAAQIQRIQNGDQKQEELQQQKHPQVKESNYQYLKKHLLPVLQGALKQVDLHRPEDPLAFIALYCLKNRDKLE